MSQIIKLPKVNMFITAERVDTGEDRKGMLNIIGLFSAIKIPALPYTLENKSLVLVFSDYFEPTINIAVQVLDSDGFHVYEKKSTLNTNIPDWTKREGTSVYSARHIFSLPLKDLSFNRVDLYTIKLFLNGVEMEGNSLSLEILQNQTLENLSDADINIKSLIKKHFSNEK